MAKKWTHEDIGKDYLCTNWKFIKSCNKTKRAKEDNQKAIEDNKNAIENVEINANDVSFGENEVEEE